jgi:Flp pilus assembly pilin Flp
MYGTTLLPILRRLSKRTEGQDLIEYALLVGILSIGIIATLSALGSTVTQMYATTAAALNRSTGRRWRLAPHRPYQTALA